MSSIIEGYNYDVFISYRQKDNKYDGWVTEFVDNLKKELEATFKEEINVYFDINPHDGLLETHDVDESLKEKLKCLVFIPIISRTYCDPKSFAWEHEFKAFVEQASKDQFGLKVKLPTGNVANRVLPVRIHDLDIADIKECESVLAGVLRGIEFIYKEPGVNRSLLPKDHEEKNLNQTNYRNQINKVALAIKEIIMGLLIEPSEALKEKVQQRKTIEEVVGEGKIPKHTKPIASTKKKVIYGVIMSAILIIAAILAYPKIFKKDQLDKLRATDGRISVAVMPFLNLTGDTTKNLWQVWLQDILINSLSANPEDLEIRQIESVNTLIESKGSLSFASITPVFAQKISRELNANVFIYGNIKLAGSVIRLNALLTNSKTGEIVKPFQIEGETKEENIFQIIDSLSTEIKNFLIISGLQKNVYTDYLQTASSTSPEAYRYFAYGLKDFSKRDFTAAINMLSKAVAIDSNLTFAILHISWAYYNMGIYDEAKKWCLKAYNKRDLMPIFQKTYTNMVYSDLFETPYESIKYWKQLQEIDDHWPQIHYGLGVRYAMLHQYDKAISELEKSLDMYDKLGLKPWYSSNYYQLIASFYETGQYKKWGKLYKKAEQDFPDDYRLHATHATLLLTLGDTLKANEYIEKCIFQRKLSSVSEAEIDRLLALIYSNANVLDRAEDYYRKALALEPGKLQRLLNLGYFLIDKDRNIEEGLRIAGKALELSPDNYNFLHTIGWGLFKQGKYQESLDILQKSWDLRRQNAIYDHEAFLHLEAAKKAVAGKKNN